MAGADMGILDYQPDPIGQGLLGLGVSLMTPRAMGGGMAAGLNAFNANALQANQLKRQQQQDALREQLLQAQMGEYKAQTKEREMRAAQLQAEAERQERIRRRLAGDGGGLLDTGGGMPSALGATTPGAPSSLGAGTPGTPTPLGAGGQMPAQPAPQGAGARPSRLSTFNEYTRLAKVYESEGDLAGATKFREMAQKSLPEVQGRDVVLVEGKPTVRLFFKDGTYEDITDAAPKADTRTENQGGYTQVRNQYTGQLEGPQVPVTMTQAQIEANKVARMQAGTSAGQLALSRQRFQYDQAQGARPQIMQGEGGFFAVTPGGAGAPPIMVPVNGPDGTPVQPKQTPPPQYVVNGLTANVKNLGVINSALQSLKTAAGKNATGAKGYLPSFMLNRVDPDGVGTRADIADIGSLTINTRSGAAVTAAEFPRLAPFIPQPTDDAQTVEKKLTRMAEIIEEENAVLGAFYPKALETARGAAAAIPPKRGAPAAVPGQPSITDLVNKYAQPR